MAVSVSSSEVYELAESLAKCEKDAKAMAQLSSSYLRLLRGTKSPDPFIRKKVGNFIARFFAHFPGCGSEALEAFFDLCEDDDDQVRLTAIRELPFLCKVLKEYLPKIVDVLAQLLQTEDEAELRMIQSALSQLYKKEVSGTLKGLFSQVRGLYSKLSI